MEDISLCGGVAANSTSFRDEKNSKNKGLHLHIPATGIVQIMQQ